MIFKCNYLDPKTIKIIKDTNLQVFNSFNNNIRIKKIKI